MIQLISYKMHNPPPFSPGLGTDRRWALCQYKHGSVWSKDYDSAGGMKIFCIYMYNMKKNHTLLTLPTSVGPKPGKAVRDRTITKQIPDLE
jgi:hypothetical protein